MNQFLISDEGHLSESSIHHAVLKTLADYPSIDPLAVESVRMITAVFGALVRKIAPYRSEFGLSGPRYSVLRVLTEADAESLSMSEIARRLAVTPPNVTKLIEGLATDGLVERHRSSRDRRVTEVAITSKGWKSFRAVTPLTLRSFDEALSGLTESDKKLLIHLLAKLRISLLARPSATATSPDALGDDLYADWITVEPPTQTSEISN